MGRDKATMPWPGASGETMVEHTIAVLATRCAPVFVVAAPGQRLPRLHAEVLRDEVPGQGPLPATALGLAAAAAAGAERAFVCAVDMPYLSGELVDQLVRYPDADVVLPWDGRDHYLAAVYRTALAGPVADLVVSGRRSMRAVLDGLVVRRVVPESTQVLRNVNSPDDIGG